MCWVLYVCSADLAPVCSRRTARRDIVLPQTRVGAHRRPAVRRRARVVPARCRLAIVARASHVPRPGEAPACGIIGAYHPRWLVGALIVGDPAAEYDQPAHDRRRRTHIVEALLDDPNPVLEIDKPGIPERRTGAPGFRVESAEAHTSELKYLRRVSYAVVR